MMSSTVGIVLILVILAAGIVWIGISYGANPDYFRENVPYQLAMRQLGKDKPFVGKVMLACQGIILSALAIAVCAKVLS